RRGVAPPRHVEPGSQGRRLTGDRFAVPTLLTPELLRRLEQFQLLAARRAKSSLKGERRSKARGQSVEFADYRNYVAGDDFRYLDWNPYGRLDRLFFEALRGGTRAARHRFSRRQRIHDLRRAAQIRFCAAG